MSSFKWLIVVCCLTSVYSAGYQCGISPNIAAYKEKLRNPWDPPQVQQRILGGDASKDGDWPFVVEIVTHTGEVDLRCTGSIIHPKWVLTARHCIVDEHTVVHYGDVFAFKGPQIGIKRFIDHPPKCNSSHCGMNDDVKLIELAEPLTFNANVTAICLSSKPFFEKPGLKLAVAGHGNTENGPNYFLRETVLLLDGIETCIASVERPPARRRQKRGKIVLDQIFCAGDSRHNILPGDSGAPIMNIQNNKWYQLGIAAESTNRIDNGAPLLSIFMRIIHFCGWIKSTTNNEVQCE